MITGPYGYLVARVIHIKDIYKKHIGLDASMANLMRPAMYGAYHHISVVGKEILPADHKYDVTGSLCETIDRFATDRMLPEVQIGDLIVIMILEPTVMRWVLTITGNYVRRKCCSARMGKL